MSERWIQSHDWLTLFHTVLLWASLYLPLFLFPFPIPRAVVDQRDAPGKGKGEREEGRSPAIRRRTVKGNNVNRSSKDKKKTSVGESTGEDAAWKRELLNDTSASGGSRFIVASFSFVVLSPLLSYPLLLSYYLSSSFPSSISLIKA